MLCDLVWCDNILLEKSVKDMNLTLWGLPCLLHRDREPYDRSCSVWELLMISNLIYILDSLIFLVTGGRKYVDLRSLEGRPKRDVISINE